MKYVKWMSQREGKFEERKEMRGNQQVYMKVVIEDSGEEDGELGRLFVEVEMVVGTLMGMRSQEETDFEGIETLSIFYWE